MSQPVKVFTVVVDDQPLPPKPFDIQFRKKDGTEVQTHSFVAHGERPAGLTLLLGSVIRYDTRGRQGVDLNGLSAFMEKAMPPADYTRFRDLIEDPELVVPMETLGEVFEWLASEYGERPTSPSSSSTDGRRRTGGSSTGKRLSTASTS